MYNTNEQIEIFLFRFGSKRKTLYRDKDRLMSYNTCVVQIDGANRVVVNITKYSNTTSKYITKILNYLIDAEMCYCKRSNIPINTQEIAYG